MSTNNPQVVYRVRNWSKHFENNRTRELRRMSWVPVSTDLSDEGLLTLLDHPNGAAHLGCWLAIIELASQCTPRGTLMRSAEIPHDVATISRVCRIPQVTIEEALQRLISREIAWIETIPQESRTNPAGSCGNTGPGRQEMEEEEKTKENIEAENSSKPASGISIDRTSDSDSTAEPSRQPADTGDESRERNIARQKFRVACSKIWARPGQKSTDGKGDQRHSDDTSTTLLFDRHVWPDGMSPVEGQQRTKQAINLIAKAANRRTPMAWLTKAVKGMKTGA